MSFSMTPADGKGGGMTLPQIVADAHAAGVLKCINTLRPRIETMFREDQIGKHMAKRIGCYDLRTEMSYASVAEAMPVPEDPEAAGRRKIAIRLHSMPCGWGANADTVLFRDGVPVALGEIKKYTDGSTLDWIYNDVWKMGLMNHYCGLPAFVGVYVTDVESAELSERIEQIRSKLNHPVTAQSETRWSVYGDKWRWCFAIWWFPACTISLDHQELQKRIAHERATRGAA
jgi:hypothetical protein